MATLDFSTNFIEALPLVGFKTKNYILSLAMEHKLDYAGNKAWTLFLISKSSIEVGNHILK